MYMSNFDFFLCRLVCPSNPSVQSHNHNFLDFYWSAGISLAFWNILWRICAMMKLNSFSAVFEGSLTEILDDIVHCWLSFKALFSMRRTTIFGSNVFLSLCWKPGFRPALAGIQNLSELLCTISLHFRRWSLIFCLSVYSCGWNTATSRRSRFSKHYPFYQNWTTLRLVEKDDRCWWCAMQEWRKGTEWCWLRANIDISFMLT